MSQPLSLTDAEYDSVMMAAAPIHPAERGLFLLALAEEIARHSIVGPGSIHRLASDLQRRYVVQARSDAATRHGEATGHRGPRQAAQDGRQDRLERLRPGGKAAVWAA
jgi:hypothetical protein